MKKNIKINALLFALGIGFAGITFAPFDEPSPTEGTSSIDRASEQMREKEELKAKQAQEKKELNEHLSKVTKKTGSKETNSASKKIKDITGSDIKLDPQGNLRGQKQEARDALAQKHSQETNDLNAQHEAEKALANDSDMFGPSQEPQTTPEEQSADQASAKDISDAELITSKADLIVKDLTSSGVLTDTDIKQLNDKVNELKLALKDRILANIRAALDALKALIAELLVKINATKGQAKSAIIEKINSLRDSINETINELKSKLSEEPKATQDQPTEQEAQEQETALVAASSIAEDLKDFDFISDDEKAELNEKIADVKQALADKVLSQIRASLDALKALLAELMIKAANAKGKASTVLREKINKLQENFDEFIKNINAREPKTEEAKTEEPQAEEPKTEAKSPELIQKENALKELGLTGNPSWEEVKRAFKKESLLNHPDKGGSVESMQAINAAYDQLKDIYGE